MGGNFEKESGVTAKMTEFSGNIFCDLGFLSHEAEGMLLRAKLAEALRVWKLREDPPEADGGCRGIPLRGNHT